MSNLIVTMIIGPGYAVVCVIVLLLFITATKLVFYSEFSKKLLRKCSIAFVVLSCFSIFQCQCLIMGNAFL